MKRTLAAALVLAFAGGVATAGDLAEIKAKGVLRVIAQKDEAPEMYSQVAGTDPGFEREMVEGFAHLHGLKIVTVAVDNSAERIPALQKGSGDVIIGIVDTAERRKLVDFTSEVIPARHIVISYRRPIETLADFKAAKVGVVKGTSWARAAVEAGIPADAMESFGDRNVMLEALKEGRITASVMTISDFTLAARKNPGVVGGLLLGEPGSASFAVRKSDAQLLQALDDYLGNFRKSPSWNRLVVKYFGESALAVLGRKN